MFQLNDCRAAASGVLGALLCGAALAAAPAEVGPPMESQQFVQAVAQAGMTEVEAARIALEISKNDAVRGFAQKMITDHQAANEQLAAIARSKSIQVPAQLDAEHAKTLQGLRSKSARQFDAAYADQMVRDHAKVIALFEPNVANPDSALAAFVARTLPILQDHKRMADNLQANLRGKKHQ